MSTWNGEELNQVGDADELRIATARVDGSLRSWVPVWVVRVGDQLYVRSYRGTGGAWYRHAIKHPEGRIQAGGVERDVVFDRPDDTVRAVIDDAYRAKYAHYGDTYLLPMISADAAAATLRLTPGHRAHEESADR
jgi:hypothetical protein